MTATLSNLSMALLLRGELAASARTERRFRKLVSHRALWAFATRNDRQQKARILRAVVKTLRSDELAMLRESGTRLARLGAF